MNDLDLKIENTKRELYFLLCEKNHKSEYSDIEVELLYQLAKDDAIQSVLNTTIKKKRNVLWSGYKQCRLFNKECPGTYKIKCNSKEPI